MLNYVAWALFAVLYAPTLYKLYNVRWDMLDYTHAYFILPISLWLIWRKRSQLKELYLENKPGNNIFGLILILLGLLLYTFGYRLDYFTISAISFIPLAFGLVIFLNGFKVAKVLSFPLLYLLLLVPPPFGILDNITLPMRHNVSVAADAVLKLLNYPVTREGLLLTIGYAPVSIGEPCSGFRSLITLLSLGLVYIYLMKGSKLKKFLLTSFIVPLALLGNLLRIVILCLITFYFGEAAGQGFFHNFSGIVMFIITVSGLMLLESIMDRTRIGKTVVK